MSETKTLPETRKDMFYVDVRNLDVKEGYNERTDYGDIQELAMLILENGILTPLKCKRSPENKERYQIVQGHRRHRACMWLLKEGKIKEIKVPLIIQPRETSEADEYVDMIAGNDGKPLNMLEQASVVSKLLKLGLDEKEIQKRLYKPLVYVQNCQLLLSAPVSVKNMIKENRISPTLVIDLFRKEKNFDKVVETLSEMDSTLGEHTGKKITKKAIDKKNAKVNSIVLFKKVLKKNEGVEINPKKKELFDFITRFINGQVSKKELTETFFTKKD